MMLASTSYYVHEVFLEESTKRMKRLVYREYQLQSLDGEFWYLSIRVGFLLLEKVMIPVIQLRTGFHRA
jgi:hypothetical protein